MDIINFALQLEVNEENLYRGLPKKIKSRNIRRIFKLLAEDEAKHYRTIEKMRNTLNINLGETDILKNVKTIFEEVKQNQEQLISQTEIIELLKEAQGLEKKNEEFYTQKANEVPKEAQKKLFLKLANDEKKHCFLMDNAVATGVRTRRPGPFPRKWPL